ncbi:MAG: histidine kinase [Verrucomicrobia bacterium]|nr:histidine kinase [Verrucomicrobiota bacterium]
MASTRIRPKWEISAPKPDFPPPESPPAARPSVHDRWIRALGYLLLGVVIPRFALLFDKLPLADPDYWLATAWFLLAAVAIWEANRALSLRLRAHLDWLVHPFWKLVILAAANLVCTVPLTIATVWLWLRHIHSPYPLFDWLATIRTIVTHNTVTVLFLLHAYETLFLIRERHGDQHRLAQLDRARLQAELENMKGQLAPHFLFNCLNTLAALIERDPPAAAAFNAHLADVSRYLLTQKNRDLVLLEEELAFLRSYVRLMELRFPRSLLITLPAPAPHDPRRLPPASLQVLLENAIKHNRLSEAEPLPIEVRLELAAAVVTNPLRPKATLPPRSHADATANTGTGLANLRERVALLTPGELFVDASGAEFRVRLPLVTA